MFLFHFKTHFYLPEHQQGRYRIWKMPTSLSFSYFFPATVAISRQQTILSLPFHFLHVAALTGAMSIAEEFTLTERLCGFCEQKSAVINFTKKAQCLFQTPCVLSSTLSNACNERKFSQTFYKDFYKEECLFQARFVIRVLGSVNEPAVNVSADRCLLIKLFSFTSYLGKINWFLFFYYFWKN